MDDFFWLPISLPSMTSDLLNAVLQHENLVLQAENKSRQIKSYHAVYNNARLYRWDVGNILRNWLLHNGITGFADISLQVVGQGHTLGPHVDGQQRIKLTYLIERGGSNVETIWYREKHQPLVRPKGLLISDYSSLLEVHRCELPLQQWGLFNTGIIHEARGIESTRRSIVISFDDYSQIATARQSQSFD